MTRTDHLLLMVRRRVADFWRTAGVDAKLADWARLYQELLDVLGSLAANPPLSSEAMREQLLALLQAHRACQPRSRAQIVHERLIEGVRPVRALLKALVRLPWQASESRRAHYRRLSFPLDPSAFLEPLAERAQAAVLAVAEGAAGGILRVDDELHLTPLKALLSP